MAGCSSSSSDSYLQKENYVFTMYDDANSIIATGTLTVKSYKDNAISGDYELTTVVKEFDGYKSMSGNKFTGKVNSSDRSALINTNPNMADNNVYFNVKIKSNRLEGDWYYTALRQDIKYNKVVIVKNKIQNQLPNKY